MIETICICGAGTMGSGIAQVCAQNGFYTILFDLNETILNDANENIIKNLSRQVVKQKMSANEKEATIDRLRFVKDTNDCVADVIIEAIVEKPDSKIALFNQLAEINHGDVIFATNTSSLSISDIQSKVLHPNRVVGMHFFNPAPIMKLVEVISGDDTSKAVAQEIFNLCLQLGKTPVMCKDSPGFIVNRVARHYYLESMRVVEEGVASFETVDDIMEDSGFKMGPFRLMDLIGMDINLSVTKGLYESFAHDIRFKPSDLQIGRVQKGELGKKTGQGFYKY